MTLFILLAILFLILLAEFVNGWTDSPNAIATVISTRTLTPRKAIILATVLNIAGAFSGTAVAETVGTGIVRVESITLGTLGATMIAIIFWTFMTWRFGLPMSKSHALVSALSGAAFAFGGIEMLLWEGWSKVLLGLLFSTLLGGTGGWLIAKTVQATCSDMQPGFARRIFSKLQILSASLMAYGHGSNDSQKFMGAFSLALVLGNVLSNFYIPSWVILICALTMGLGTSIGGMRIIRVMGYKIVPLETYQGFSAEASAASAILLASHFGIPLSTTHTINMSILGVGVARHKKLVHWNVFFSIVKAWLLTFPICALVSFLGSWIYLHVGWLGLLSFTLLLVLFVLSYGFFTKLFFRLRLTQQAVE
jgi:PiT family inorganic phosphate transporter